MRFFERQGSAIWGMVFLGSLLLFTAAGKASCDGKINRANDVALSGVNAAKVGIMVSAGKDFTNFGRFLIFPFRKGAQVAAWAVDGNGRYAGTFFVTEKTAQEDWISAPEEGRPESLPVWSHAAADNSSVDAVAAATKDVSDNEAFMTCIELPAGRYKVFLEANISYDWNSVWSKKADKENPYYNGVNGQPSLIYEAGLDLTEPLPEEGLKIQFHPAGTGHPLGLDGNIYRHFDGIDTAFAIIDTAFVIAENK